MEQRVCGKGIQGLEEIADTAIHKCCLLISPLPTAEWNAMMDETRGGKRGRCAETRQWGVTNMTWPRFASSSVRPAAHLHVFRNPSTIPACILTYIRYYSVDTEAARSSRSDPVPSSVIVSRAWCRCGSGRFMVTYLRNMLLRATTGWRRQSPYPQLLCPMPSFIAPDLR